MSSQGKKISIITTLNNSCKSVLETFNSLENQLDSSVEWIIKNSQKIASPDVQRLAKGRDIKLINCLDKGLYDGLNQALEHCEGDFVWVVGAGDRFLPLAVPAVLNSLVTIEGNEAVDSICFPIYHRALNRIILPDPANFGPQMSCPHPGTILKTKNVKEIGGFDLRYEIAADFDLLLRYFSRWNGSLVGSSPIIDFEGGGVSERRINEAALESDLARARFQRINSA
jgi:glycosyltransferase